MRNAFSFIAFILLLSLLSEHVSGQSKDHYLKLGKRQNTWGWIVAGTVPVFITAGLLIKEHEHTGYFEPPQVLSDRAQLFISAGTAAVISGILFAASSKNKKHALQMGVAYTRSGGIINLRVPINHLLPGKHHR